MIRTKTILLITTLAILTSCASSSKKYFLVNTLNEEVKVFVFNTKDVGDKGELTLLSNQQILLHDLSTKDPQSEVSFSSSRAIHKYFEVQEVDSLVIQFKDDTIVSYKSDEFSSSLNPLNESNWNKLEIDKNEVEWSFKIIQAHKEVAN